MDIPGASTQATMKNVDLNSFSTGLPGLDRILLGLQAGDNVVWQVETVDEYLPSATGPKTGLFSLCAAPGADPRPTGRDHGAPASRGRL
jgi:hypothetical protein